MNVNHTASASQRAREALAELFRAEIAGLAASGGVDMASVEDAAIAVGHAAMAAALGAALESLDLELRASLPDGCRVKDRRPRTLATKVGDVTFRATRVRSPLGCSEVPLFDALDLPRGARISPAACDLLVEAGRDVSYARAARLLARAGGSAVSPSAVMRQMRSAGALCAEEDAALAGSLYGDGVLPGGEEAAAELRVEADGTWFSVQGAPGGGPRRCEVKAVCAYAGKEERGGKVRRVGVARHACVEAPREFSMEAVAAVGERYDLSKVERVWVGSDGEGWRKALGAFLPRAEASGRLDPFHVNRAVLSCFDDPAAGWQVLWALWDGGEEAAASLLEASAELGLARPGRTERVLGYLRNNMELLAADGPSMGTMESENQHVYGVRMDSFPCAWSVRGASDMARLRSRSVSGRAIPRMTREGSLSPGRRAARERREIAALARGSAAGVPPSSGSGYEPPHRASLAAARADVRYTAGADKGMLAIGG